MTAPSIPDQRAGRDPRGACIAGERQDLDKAQCALSPATRCRAVFVEQTLPKNAVGNAKPVLRQRLRG